MVLAAKAVAATPTDTVPEATTATAAETLPEASTGVTATTPRTVTPLELTALPAKAVEVIKAATATPSDSGSANQIRQAQNVRKPDKSQQYNCVTFSSALAALRQHLQ
jgi:hypothetical protein